MNQHWGEREEAMLQDARRRAAEEARGGRPRPPKLPLKNLLNTKLRDIDESIAAIRLDGSSNASVAVAGMVGMCTQVAARLRAERRPLEAHIAAADHLQAAVMRLDACRDAPSLADRLTSEAAFLVGYAASTVDATEDNRRVAVKDRQAGLVTPLINQILDQQPDLTTRALADAVHAASGMHVSDGYLRKVKRRRRGPVPTR